MPPARISIRPTGIEASGDCAAPVIGTDTPGTTNAALTDIGNTSFELTAATSLIVVPPGASTVTGIDRGGNMVPGGSAVDTA
jgi:hypothetical protein